MQLPVETRNHPSQFRSFSQARDRIRAHDFHRSGDLAQLNHAQRVELINRAVLTHHEASKGTDQEANRVNKINQRSESFRRFVADESNYPKDARTSIVRRYLTAESQITADDDNFTKVAKRIVQFPEPAQLVTDMDGTITVIHSSVTTPEASETPTYPAYLKHVPGSAIFEPILATEGREAFLSTHASTHLPLVRDVPGMYYEAAQYKEPDKKATGPEIRAGVDEFFAKANNNGMIVRVLSANYEPFVVGILDRIPNADGIQYAAVTHDDITSTEKGLHIQDAASQNPNSPIYYVGDGESDISAIQAKDYVAAYFALDESLFAKELAKENLPYFTYKDFHDITNTVMRLHAAQQDAHASN